jgi:spore coat protein A
MESAITRRDALIGASRILASTAMACRFPAGSRTNAGVASRFQREIRVPPTLRPVRTDDTTDCYELTQRLGISEIRSGTRTTIWGFEGITPGPTIHARRGRRVVVNQTNHLNVPTVVHLHGGATPPR